MKRKSMMMMNSCNTGGVDGGGEDLEAEGPYNDEKVDHNNEGMGSKSTEEKQSKQKKRSRRRRSGKDEKKLVEEADDQCSSSPASRRRKQRKREDHATLMTMYCAEEAYYRALQPPCNFCGTTEKVEFRYFNNRYRTKGTRISSFDQPRYRCRSCSDQEFNPFNLTRYNPAGDHDHATTCNVDEYHEQAHHNNNIDHQNKSDAGNNIMADAAAHVNQYHDLEAAAEEAIQYLLHIPAQAEESELLEVIHLQDPIYDHLCSNHDELAGTISSSSSMILSPHRTEDIALESIYNSLEDLLVLDERLISIPAAGQLVEDSTVAITQGELVQPLVNGPPAPASCNVQAGRLHQMELAQVPGVQLVEHEAMMMGLAATTHDMNSSWTNFPQLADDEDDQLIYNEFSSLWD